MNLTVLAFLFLVLLVSAYYLYGRWVAAQFSMDDARLTPANVINDGVDYVPTRPFYLFSQHFSAIAAAGPIAGPILACMAFGWLPCLLWIAIGVVVVGAVHDFSSLTASVRRGGTSIAEVTGDILGNKAGLAMMVFIWIALIYVIVAFTDITAGSFVGKTEELQAASGSAITFNRGGAVAMAAILYLVLSILLGFVERYLKPPLWLTTVIFVPATLGMVWLGTKLSTIFILDAKSWGLLILIYCFVASLTPVWALLQPRGYLGGFVLFLAIGLGIIGVFFGGYSIEQPAFKGWQTGFLPGTSAANTLFPFLFVTIACGACSGFHGLVCSGTTSKQIDKESHCHPVGYGAMLAEGFVAFIALVTIMMITPEQALTMSGADPLKPVVKPGVVYGAGIGEFMTLIIGKENLQFAIVFGAMAFSTFVFDTLDVCTRLGRYLIQELAGWKTTAGAVGATVLTILPAAYFIANSQSGSYLSFWTLFGASNQLLAALTLLSITVWLYQARRRIAFTLIPMIFVLVTTLTALVNLAIGNLVPLEGQVVTTMGRVNGLVSIALILLALYLAGTALLSLKGERNGTLVLDATPAPDPA